MLGRQTVPAKRARLKVGNDEQRTKCLEHDGVRSDVVVHQVHGVQVLDAGADLRDALVRVDGEAVPDAVRERLRALFKAKTRDHFIAAGTDDVAAVEADDVGVRGAHQGPADAGLVEQVLAERRRAVKVDESRRFHIQSRLVPVGTHDEAGLQDRPDGGGIDGPQQARFHDGELLRRGVATGDARREIFGFAFKYDVCVEEHGHPRDYAPAFLH